jgi:4-coumarate--CoA ligase
MTEIPTSELGPRFYDLLISLAPGGIALLPHGVKRAPLGSAGQLMPGVVARIVKPDGTLGGPGERGELVVKSLSTALGYLDAPEA